MSGCMKTGPGEHLMPFMFAFGAGGWDAVGTCEHKEYLGSLPIAAYAFRAAAADHGQITAAATTATATTTDRQHAHGGAKAGAGTTTAKL